MSFVGFQSLETFKHRKQANIGGPIISKHNVHFHIQTPCSCHYFYNDENSATSFVGFQSLEIRDPIIWVKRQSTHPKKKDPPVMPTTQGQ